MRIKIQTAGNPEVQVKIRLEKLFAEKKVLFIARVCRPRVCSILICTKPFISFSLCHFCISANSKGRTKVL